MKIYDRRSCGGCDSPAVKYLLVYHFCRPRNFITSNSTRPSFEKPSFWPLAPYFGLYLVALGTEKRLLPSFQDDAPRATGLCRGGG